MITLYDNLESRLRSQDSMSNVVNWAKIDFALALTLIRIYFYGLIATFEVGIKKSDIGAKEENLLEFLLLVLL